jgi:hypothetical protein
MQLGALELRKDEELPAKPQVKKSQLSRDKAKILCPEAEAPAAAPSTDIIKHTGMYCGSEAHFDFSVGTPFTKQGDLFVEALAAVYLHNDSAECQSRGYNSTVPA